MAVSRNKSSPVCSGDNKLKTLITLKFMHLSFCGQYMYISCVVSANKRKSKQVDHEHAFLRRVLKLQGLKQSPRNFFENYNFVRVTWLQSEISLSTMDADYIALNTAMLDML